MKKALNKKIAKGTALLLSSVLAAGISQAAFAETADVEPENTKEAAAPEFAEITADFAVRLMQQVLEKDHNRLVAPESISEALAMTASGAAGDTLTEMQSTVMGTMDLQEYQKQLSEFRKRLEASKRIKFSSADAIWVNEEQGLTLKEDFVKQNEEAFEAALHSAVFDDTTRDEINGWVRENTDQMIDSIVDRLSKDSLMYLLNATVFEGEWMDPYYYGSDSDTFTSAAGETQQVEMLSSEEETYLELNGGVGFVKPYIGGQFAFVGLLPEEGVTLEDYVAKLTGAEFVDAFRNRKDDKYVDVKLPKFQFDDSLTLQDTLSDMGMPSAFGASADFSGMVEEDVPLYIGSVLHKTHIDVDENGTKAAAATAVEMKVMGAAPEAKETLEVHLNRPYLYAIVDVETGIPLFFGAQNTME